MTATRLTAALCLALCPGAALAGLNVCNQTDASASIAIGYNDNGDWTSEGWWNVAAGDCVTVVGGDLTRSFYYWRATSPGRNWENQRYMFCTTPSAFTIVGDTDCEARGHETAAFNEIALDGATDYTLTLTAAPQAGGGAAPKAPAGDPPGTHGEPYTIAGILSHCGFTDTTIECEVHADGWRYVASSANPTDIALLEELDLLDWNTPIWISGDMIGYDNVTAEVTIREYELTGTDLFAGARSAIQGYWISEDDPRYTVLVTGGILEEYYDNIPTETAIVGFRNGCDGIAWNGPAFELTSFATGEADRCMLLVEATGDSLVLGPAGAMNDLRFRR